MAISDFRNRKQTIEDVKTTEFEDTKRRGNE